MTKKTPTLIEEFEECVLHLRREIGRTAHSSDAYKMLESLDRIKEIYLECALTRREFEIYANDKNNG